MNDSHEDAVIAVTTYAAQNAGKAALAALDPTLGATVGVLADLGKLIAPAFFTTGTARLQAAVAEEIAEAALRRLPEVEQKVRELLARDVPISPNDFARILSEFARAYQNTADAKKRKVLEDAFVNSFSQDLYDAGLLTVLWQKLDRLSYGDLRLLKEIADAGENAEKTVIGKAEVKNKATVKSFHYNSLAAEMLVSSNIPEGGALIQAADIGLLLTELSGI